MNHRDLLHAAISIYKNDLGVGNPSLEESGVGLSRVTLRDASGNILASYEIDQVSAPFLSVDNGSSRDTCKPTSNHLLGFISALVVLSILGGGVYLVRSKGNPEGAYDYRASASRINSKSPAPPLSKQQRILRLWRGNPRDSNSKSVCGIYTLPFEVERMQAQGWSIKSTTPINYRINQKWYYYDCFGSEVIMEK